MLVTMKEILDRAQEGNYAVAAPNVISEVEGRAILEAAEELQSPLILDISYKGAMDMVFFGSYINRLADQASVPVATNLDHGKDFDQCIIAVRAGLTSLMVDRSTLPLAENIRQVREIVRVAHSAGMSVEAELGHVSEGSEYEAKREIGMTDPAEAGRFVRETGVDCLAVAIGTAHGTYSSTPVIDFDRITRIKQAAGIPLVVHGASGTGEENLRRMCRMGINKVNVSNDLLRAASEEIQTNDMTGDGAYQLWKLIQKGYKRRLKEYIELLGSGGKAWTPGPRKLYRKEIEMSES